jgi:6-phosphogluconolactonase
MKLRRFDTPQELTEAAAALLIEHFERPSERPSAVMLSGGKTPLAAYERVAKSGVQAAENAFVLFSDERMVPIDALESNYAAALPMINALGLPPSRVIRVRTEKTPADAAKGYAEELRRFLDQGGYIPLGLLGLGADGHTASLFSAADLERGRDSCVIAVPRVPGPDRVSVTPNLLRHVERIIFLVTGQEKAAAMDGLLRNSKSTPAALALREHPHVEVWDA